MAEANPDFIEKALDEQAIRDKILEEERLAEEHARRAEGWRLILRGRSFLAGGAAIRATSDITASPSRANGDKPDTNAEAVLRIVASKPTKFWRPAEVMNELEERGWQFGGVTPRKTLGATLSVLRSKGRLEKGGRGEYKLALSRDQDELFQESLGES
jgi:hypothetical protein